ncbi:MAG: glycoside hydrolase family 2 TIM barrel-domain containing protein [Patescibacteria group bacterium]
MARRLWDEAWRFRPGDADGRRVTRADYDDTGWRLLDLPHDYSIETPRDAKNPSGASNGFFGTGAAWYRKSFSLPESERGARILVEFEGVYMNAEVWCNGHVLGRHPYGYTSFWHDLTPFVVFGGGNVLAVRVDNAQQLNSRWYSGSGIYRHVWLVKTDPVHIAPWGVCVTTPEVAKEAARARLRATVVNETAQAREVAVRWRVVAPGGESAGAAESGSLVAAGGRAEIEGEIAIAGPLLWSPDTPHLYLLETEVMADGRAADAATTAFGIRSFSFDANQGFVLNGAAMKLRGGCVHHDNGVMGAASFDRSEERKVELLKASGYNAVRCAHNPPAQSFLDACDRLGMLVIDEAFDCWREGKNPYDYHVSFDDWWRRDVESMVLRDRNHPSVIMWSIGNELCERGQPEGARIAEMLAAHVRSLDPTRPVTAAINGVEDWAVLDGLFAALDVCGYNYQFRQYRPDHERHPGRVVYGSESAPKEAFENWEEIEALGHAVGDFVWTSLDYLGESGIGRVHFDGDKAPFLGDFPWHQANCGDLDLCGWKRPQSYYRDILWGRGDKLYIAVHAPVPEGKTPTVTYWGWPDVHPSWTWPGCEGRIMQIDVYAACDEVELFLNGRSVGRKPSGRAEKHIASFEIPYEAGTLLAMGYAGGAKIAERALATAGPPVRIRLSPDRGAIKASRGDLSFVAVEVVDAEGRIVPNAAQNILFTVSGEGALAAVGSADPQSTEPYRGNQRRVHRGRCLAVVQSLGRPGSIRLRAQADGLEGAEAVIEAE